MNLIEVNICAVAVTELRSQGWQVACEIPMFQRVVDAVAIRDGNVLAIEAKKVCNRRLLHQLSTCSIAAELCLAVVGSKPRAAKIDWLRERGFGLWIVEDGKVNPVLWPDNTSAKHPWHPVDHYRSQLIEAVTRMNGSNGGGMPNLRGVGPAQDTQRAISEFRREHPLATWKELYAAIPNHYVSANSMRSAMRMLGQRLYWRDKKPSVRNPKSGPVLCPHCGVKRTEKS